MNEYLFEYRYGGAVYGITIRADSEHEARQRLVCAGANGQFRGQVFATVHVPGGGILLRLWNWITRN
jgi:hypothetical protein